MEKDTNKEYINVLTDTGKTALLLFFMACCKEGEGDNGNWHVEEGGKE